jgi:aminoglycoside phosphotransferase (APT) family kinase protein
MPWTDWGSNRARLWPDPDDRPGDLNATVAAPWLDEIAVRLRERLARVPDPLVIGHGDFEAQNLRFVDGEPYAVHDWDSALAAPEPVLAGFAAAVWPLGAVPGSSATSATLAQTEAFLDAYQRARAVRWNTDQLGAAWAAGLWVLAFNAKKAALSGEIDQLDRADAAQRLRHAGC